MNHFEYYNIVIDYEDHNRRKTSFEKYQRLKNFLIEDISKNKSIFFCEILFKFVENPYEYFLQIDEKLYNKEKVLKYAIYFGNIKIVKHIILNFNTKIDIDSSIDDIKVLEFLKEYYAENINSSIESIFYKTCIKGCTDVVTYILENFNINSKIFCDKITTGNYQDIPIISPNFISTPSFPIDVLTLLFEKYPNIFSNSEDFKINCDLNTAILFRFYGLGRKINIISIIEHIDFLKDCRYEIGLYDFLNEFSVRWFYFDDIFRNYFKLISSIEDYTLPFKKFKKFRNIESICYYNKNVSVESFNSYAKRYEKKL